MENIQLLLLVGDIIIQMAIETITASIFLEKSKKEDLLVTGIYEEAKVLRQCIMRHISQWIRVQAIYSST